MNACTKLVPTLLSMMFVEMARSLPSSGVPEWCFTQVGSGLGQKIRPGPNIIKLFFVRNFRNKLERLSLASLDSLV